MTDKDIQIMAKQLGGIIEGDVFTDNIQRLAFSTDASIYRIVPSMVAAPKSGRDVSLIINFARQHGLPVCGRGAGSGVAGESLTSGIVLDMNRYLNRLLEVSEDGGSVVCQPGLVLNELNEYLAKYGRKIGPDPSSGNRATVGGCVANNATGAHWLKYGYFADHLESVEAVLDDGSIVKIENDFQPDEVKCDRLNVIGRESLELLSKNEKVIKESLPKTKRNRSGYNIFGVAKGERIDLARLLAGSEGTLAIFTEIKLRTVAIPSHKVLFQLEFDDLSKMAAAVPLVVDSGASACELMGRGLLEMAYEAFPKYRDILPKDKEAVLLVEHDGSSEDELKEKIEKTRKSVGEKASGLRIFFDAAEQKRLWKSRKEAVPLLSRKKGRKHPVACIEDVSVDNARLDEYIRGLKELEKKYSLSMAYYGHAGDGELHIRPFMDLSKKADRDTMSKLVEDVFELAWSLGGSISGEHADGLVRAAFLRGQYGDEYYEVLCGLKQIFDPGNFLNPGKILHEETKLMLDNLRAEGEYIPQRLESSLYFDKDEFLLELDQCSGCGLCLSQDQVNRMCPVYRAVGEELGSSRAKANVLREWAKGNIADHEFESASFKKLLGLCINCKACSKQCPSGVDVSKLVTAARTEYARRKNLTLSEMFLSNNRFISRLGAMSSAAANLCMKLPVAGWMLEKVIGIDKGRRMPAFANGEFVKKSDRYLSELKSIDEPVDKVAYFVDTYVNFNDHSIGKAVLEFFNLNGIEVIVPSQKPAPLPAIVYGDVGRARSDLEYSVKYLAEAVRDGYKIVCSEPSAALCLKDELRYYVDGEDAEIVSENTFEFVDYVYKLTVENKIKPVKKDVGGILVYHRPCHALSLDRSGDSPDVLRKLSGVEVDDLDGGCCGLAGTFGMQKKNKEISEMISKNLRSKIESHKNATVVTECGACAMQIRHISGADVRHPAQVLLELYKQ